MAIDIPEDAEQFINTGFAERLKNNSPSDVDVIVEVNQGNAEPVIQRLQQFGVEEVLVDRVIQDRYIPARVMVDDVPGIARINGVELVHQDTVAGITGLSDLASRVDWPNPANNEVRVRAEEFVLAQMMPDRPFEEAETPGRVEVPRFNLMPTPFGDPLQAGLAVVDNKTKAEVYDTEFITSFDSVATLLDGVVTEGFNGADTQVAALDTGFTPLQPSTGSRNPRRESTVPGEGGLDLLGHGTWVTSMMAGKRHPSPWGPCRGVAPNAVMGHFKCLNSFPGFGKTSWILLAMERALDWGADVINMSLGGTQQGPVQEDPYARFIRDNCKENAGDRDGAIFVVAAGNAGPDKWTIGSPGIAPKALTVGAWSLMDDAPSYFSSRGPQGEWYKDNEQRFEADMAGITADEFVKPDVAAPGGGRGTVELSEEREEVIWQAEVGWMEGFHDGIRDSTGGMAGTSMACPHVAGLVARLYDAGIIDTAAEVKQVVKQRGVLEGNEWAAPGATEQVNGKNISAGFGFISEELYDP